MEEIKTQRLVVSSPDVTDNKQCSIIPQMSLVNAPADAISNENELKIYNRFSNTRKKFITFTMALCGLMAAMASMNIIAAIPEVATEFRTTGSIINVSNALYMVIMGICTLVWGPLSE